MTKTTYFGNAHVRLEDKQPLVNDVFQRVANRYDLMNDVMSFGLHRAWKDALVAKLRVPPHRHFHVLDLAGGTGDVAARILKAGGAQTHVTLSDINADMLAQAQRRLEDAPFAARLSFAEANAQDLPFEDGSFDAVTIAFGLRNVPEPHRALKEARRVLKRGGQFLCLEFSQCDVPVLERLYDAYSYRLIPGLGAVLASNRAAYQYLVDSIRTFYNPTELAALMEDAGFACVSHEAFSFRVVALHRGWAL